MRGKVIDPSLTLEPVQGLAKIRQLGYVHLINKFSNQYTNKREKKIR